MNFKHLRKADGTVWRITKLRITETSLVDNPANDMATIEEMELAKRYIQEQTMSASHIRPEIAKFLSDRGFSYLVKGKTNPQTGTSTDSRGDGGPSDESASAIQAALSLAREVVGEMIALTSDNPSSPSVDYDEMWRRALRVVANRLGMPEIVDWSGDNDNPDPSLNPNGPGAAAVNAYRDASEAIEQMDRAPSGFELAKRILSANGEDATLLAKLRDRNRVGIAGASDALLKHEGGDELRKLADDRAGTLDLRRILSEVGDPQLEKRLSERDGMRKTMDFDVFHGGSAAPFAGSYNPGCLADPLSDLTKRIDRIHRGGGNEIEKLLH